MITCLSPDGCHIASGTKEGLVRVHNLMLGNEQWRFPEAHRGSVRVLAWSPDGSALASGGDDARVNVWHMATGALLTCYTGHSGPIFVLDWSPDSNWIASSEAKGSPHIWPSCPAAYL